MTYDLHHRGRRNRRYRNSILSILVGPEDVIAVHLFAQFQSLNTGLWINYSASFLSFIVSSGKAYSIGHAKGQPLHRCRTRLSLDSPLPQPALPPEIRHRSKRLSAEVAEGIQESEAKILWAPSRRGLSAGGKWMPRRNLERGYCGKHMARFPNSKISP